MKTAKAWIAALGALNAWGVTAFADGGVSPVELFGLTAIPIAFLGTWYFKNSVG